MELNTLRFLELPPRYTLPFKGFEDGYRQLQNIRQHDNIDLKRLVSREGSDLGEKEFEEIWENRHVLPGHLKQEIGRMVVGLCFMRAGADDERGETFYPFIYWRDGEWRQDRFYNDGR